MQQIQEEWGYIRRALTEPGLIVGGLFLVMWLSAAPLPDGAKGGLLVLLVWLWCLARIDAENYLLPDLLTLSGLIIGLIAAPTLLGVAWWSSLAAAIAGGAFFAGLNALFSWLKGYDGMGMGDVKLLAMLGAWVGLTGLPLVLLVASFAAVLFLVLRLIFRRAEKRSPTVPYGPFLAIGGWVVALHQPWLWAQLKQLNQLLYGG